MHRIASYAVIACLLLLALPAVAQEDTGPIARVYRIKPKAGMAPQFEEAQAAHAAWHREKGDTWTWVIRQIETGENYGQYAAITSGHQWADFDNPAVPIKEDLEHFFSTAGQYVESTASSIWALLPDVSRPSESDEPAAVGQAIFFEIHRGKTDEFMNAVRKVNKAIEKTNWTSTGRSSFWAALVSGGYHPTYVLVLNRENWAGFTPQEKPFEDMLKEAYGEQEAGEILKVFDKTIKSQRSQTSVYRPDLSYIPAGQ